MKKEDSLMENPASGAVKGRLQIKSKAEKD